MTSAQLAALSGTQLAAFEGPDFGALCPTPYGV
jgi:hypothetical protein